MIRLVFVVFVCLGGFAAATLWSLRHDDGGSGATRLSERMEAAVQAQLEHLDAEAAALLSEAEAIADRTADASDAEPSDSGSGRAGAVAAPPPAPPLRNPLGDDAERFEVQDLSAPADFARDLGDATDAGTAFPIPDAGDGAGGDPRSAAADAAGDDGAVASADLIRRMLAVYPQPRERR
jgi:hypothetical protein